MNQMRMDAEGGGRVIHRSRRGGMLAMVVTLQNLLVIACLVVTLHFYSDFRTCDSEVIDPMQFRSFSGSMGNKTLELNDPAREKDNVIKISCTGPYIWYMEVCYGSYKSEKSRGILQLQVKDRKDPAYSFTLDATSMVCRGLHSTVYLKAQEVTSLYLYSNETFFISNMTMGLSYLLRKCHY